MNFSIIIPVFNEESCITNLVDEIFLSLNNKDLFDVIIVNDASTDTTDKKLENLKKKYLEKIIVLNNNINLGQSLSIIKGIKMSKNDTIVTIDGDGQNNPKDINSLLKIYFSDDDLFLVGGIREKRKDNILKIISSKIANKIRGYILSDDCKDTGCSLKVFDRKVFLSFPEFNGIHRFLPALFKGYGKKTVFINVDHRARIYGYSKYGTFYRAIFGIRDLIRVYKIIKEYKKKKC